MSPVPNVKLLDRCRIFPKPTSDFRPSLPLTFFDIIFLPFPPVQRLFFFEYPHPKSHFLDSDLPNLKHSLSLALHHFYPFAGNLVTTGENPEIHCSGTDSVAFLVAVSGDDFNELSANHPREVTRFHSLVPSLLSYGSKRPVLSVQVTVFPNAGIGIGTTLHHAVADGSTYAHFMKTWASICNFGNQTVPTFKSSISLPSYDRKLIRDPKGIKSIFLEDLEAFEKDRSLEVWDLYGRPSVVRATFVLTRDHLNKLGTRTTLKCSPYALTCGYIWSTLLRARGDHASCGNNRAQFGFVTGCRPRHDPPLPATYFGNCLGICRVEAKRSDLVGKDGAAAAADAIWRVIRGLDEGVFGRTAEWVRDVFDYAAMRALTVAGSPKLGIYEVDFGWGRARKVEMVSIERTGALSLAEGREEDGGGIEVGMALPRNEMDKFVAIFEDGIRNLS